MMATKSQQESGGSGRLACSRFGKRGLAPAPTSLMAIHMHTPHDSAEAGQVEGPFSFWYPGTLSVLAFLICLVLPLLFCR